MDTVRDALAAELVSAWRRPGSNGRWWSGPPTLADRVIANYRTPAPTVRESQWRTAREVLARAVGVAPQNRQLKAALRYCEGHLHRINGEARKARHELEEGQRELTEAVAAFREAAELRPNGRIRFSA